MKKIFFVLGILFCNYTMAGVIYDESVNGDTSGWWWDGGADLGLVGDNDTVLGSVSYSDVQHYWDGYFFTLNGAMDQITITAESGSVHNGWQLYSENVSVQYDYLSFIGDSVVFDVTGLSGIFSIGNNYLWSNSYYDYSIVFNGTVPEPSILLLMATGLAGLGFSSRKKKLA